MPGLIEQMKAEIKAIKESGNLEAIPDGISEKKKAIAAYMREHPEVTSKSAIAKAIHNMSSRANGPFIEVNCAVLHENLIESELFGYEKGAFTGAASGGKIGKIELANHGTLFLDEVGNLALETQQMLLRAIQERRYRPVGDKADRNFNVRIIAATNENLELSLIHI